MAIIAIALGCVFLLHAVTLPKTETVKKINNKFDLDKHPACEYWELLLIFSHIGHTPALVSTLSGNWKFRLNKKIWRFHNVFQHWNLWFSSFYLPVAVKRGLRGAYGLQMQNPAVQERGCNLPE